MASPALSALRPRTSRPRQLTQATVRKICDLVERGVPQQAAAGSLGIPRRTYQEWLQKGRADGAVEPYASFAERIEEALDRFHATRAVIVGESTDERTTLEVLRRRFKDDWADPDRGGSTVNVQVVVEAERRSAAEAMLAAAHRALGDDPERLARLLAELAGGEVVEGEAAEVAELGP